MNRRSDGVGGEETVGMPNGKSVEAVQLKMLKVTVFLPQGPIYLC